MVYFIKHLSYMIILSHVLVRTKTELFTALSEMEPLLDTHKRVIDDLDRYIDKAKRRLQILKKHLYIYKTEHQKAMEDIPNYLGNPINAFTLIKRLTTDLDDIEYRITAEHIKNITLRHADVLYPTLDDVAGTALALNKLQEVYNLNVKDLSEGIVNGESHSTIMGVGDCYELGRALFYTRRFKNAIAWMLEALRKFDNTDSYLFKQTDILEYISFAHYASGDAKNAVEWTKKLLKMEPGHPRASVNMMDFQNRIDEDEKHARNLRGEKGTKKPEQVLPKSREITTYEALCRGEMQVHGEITMRLHCRYLRGHHPFLRLAPIKMELVYWQPDVVLFHDVISDNEIHVIQDLAKPRFRRSLVYDASTDEIMPVNIRISKSGWLRDEESPVVARLSQRVADMTGLSMISAESLQVVNYGIGGYYDPHLDFQMKQSYNCTGQYGNKLATVMFYMSDVAQGGATVFTELGVSVSPVKGAALFWMNLHPSGEGDLATRHAGCPVLRGDKWVCNKWIHQGGQELLRPCMLQHHPEGSMRKLPHPVLCTAR